MYSEIAAVIQSVSALNDLLRASKELSNRNEFVAAVSEVNEKLLAANAVALACQEKQAALTQEIDAQKERLMKLEDWEAKMERYELFRFPSGTFAYRLKEGVDPGQPVHYLCPDCVNERKPTILQPTPEATGYGC